MSRSSKQEEEERLRALVGTDVLVPLSDRENVRVWMRVVDVGWAFGHGQLLVKPIAGMGTMWIRSWEEVTPIPGAT
jgi:hypothetical protein